MFVRNVEGEKIICPNGRQGVRTAVKVVRDSEKSRKSSLRSRPAGPVPLPPVQVLAVLACTAQLAVRHAASLSLPHSQVRFRISSAWSSSRFRLVVRFAVLGDQFLVQFGESGVGG